MSFSKITGRIKGQPFFKAAKWNLYIECLPSLFLQHSYFYNYLSPGKEDSWKQWFLHLPKVLKCVCQYGNKIRPQGSSATCVTLGLLKRFLSFITDPWAMRNGVSYSCSSHNDLLHELLHWLWWHRKQHSAKLKIRLSGLIRAAIFPFLFFLNQRMPFN